MPLIPQTYPVTDGANSYGDVAGFKAYHDDRLNDYAAFTDPQITAAVIEATTYVDMRFAYIGWRTVAEQTTEFPRNDLYNARGDIVQGIPWQVVNATYEYAIRWLRGGLTLVPDPTQDETGQVLKAHEIEAGPIRERKEYSAFGTYQWPAYPKPDGILKASGFVENPRTYGIISAPTGRA
jgi:hypothetical protein